jgi:predicted PurR-regulated permease PerM
VIPNLGVIIPLVPIAIFTLSAHPDRLLFVLGTYMLIQQVESSILSPMVVKRQMNIPVGVVLVFQLVAGTLFGFLGVLLAVPMLGVLITLVREVYVYDILGVRNIELTLEESDEGEFVLSADLIPPDNLT